MERKLSRIKKVTYLGRPAVIRHEKLKGGIEVTVRQWLDTNDVEEKRTTGDLRKGNLVIHQDWTPVAEKLV